MAARNEFRHFVAARARPKMIRGKEIDGNTLGSLIAAHAEAIRNKDINIESTFEAVMRLQNEKALQLGLAAFRECLAGVGAMPVSSDAFQA